MGEQLNRGVNGVLAITDPDFVLSPERFAHHRTALSGQIHLFQSGRLKEWLLDSSSVMAFDLIFSFNDRGVPVVKGQIHAELKTQCLRCYEPMLLPLSLAVNLQLMDLDSSLARGLDDDDVLTFAGQTLQLKDLIEEEIILNMPMSPRHLDNACQWVTNING